MITGQLGVYCPRLTYVDTLYVILVKLFPVKGFLPHEFLRLRFLSNKSLMSTTKASLLTITDDAAMMFNAKKHRKILLECSTAKESRNCNGSDIKLALWFLI